MGAIKISNKMVILSLLVILAGGAFAAGTAGLFDWRAAAGKIPVVGKMLNPSKTKSAAYSPLQLENDRLKKENTGLNSRLNRYRDDVASLTAVKEDLESELALLKKQVGDLTAAEEGYEGLALMYNQMKPAAVANIMAEMDEQTSLGVLAKMETEQAGKVLACLAPQRAAALVKLMVNPPTEAAKH